MENMQYCLPDRRVALHEFVLIGRILQLHTGMLVVCTQTSNQNAGSSVVIFVPNIWRYWEALLVLCWPGMYANADKFKQLVGLVSEVWHCRVGNPLTSFDTVWDTYNYQQTKKMLEFNWKRTCVQIPFFNNCNCFDGYILQIRLRNRWFKQKIFILFRRIIIKRQRRLQRLVSSLFMFVDH